MMSALLLPLLAAALAGAQSPGPVVRRQAGEIDWKSSASIPTGRGTATHEYHLIYEHKTTAGVQTLVRFSKGFTLPPHSHTHDETIVVLSGKLTVSGDGGETTLKPGGYAVVPGGVTHALGAPRGCELVITFAGPVDFKGLPQVK